MLASLFLVERLLRGVILKENNKNHLLKVLALWCPCSAIAQNLVGSKLPPSSCRYHNILSDFKTFKIKTPLSLENRSLQSRVVGLRVRGVQGRQRYVVFSVFLGCAARPKAVLRYWARGCQACLDRTWGDALEQMLAEHAAQARVFSVFVENLGIRDNVLT